MRDDEARRSNPPIPPKRVSNRQVELEIDQRTTSLPGNADFASLNIDPAHLFTQAIEQTRMALCISDPAQEDCPIVYTNTAFIELTGYPIEEILGRNCRFLQGEDTSVATIDKMRRAVRNEAVTVVDVLNYRKDGTPFWNAVHIGPIFDEYGKLVYFYGSQWDVTEIFNQREESLRNREQAEQARQVADELQHRTGNLFAVLTAIVRMSARGANDVATLTDKIERRLGALARAHRVTIGSDDRAGKSSGLRGLVETVLEPYRSDNRDRIFIEGKDFRLPLRAITPVGLTLHELATNALKYGSLGHDGGTVTVDWFETEHNELTVSWTERGGPAPITDKPRGSGTGTRIVSGILGGINAAVERNFAPNGLTATITLPLDLDDDAA